MGKEGEFYLIIILLLGAAFFLDNSQNLLIGKYLEVTNINELDAGTYKYTEDGLQPAPTSGSGTGDKVGIASVDIKPITAVKVIKEQPTKVKIATYNIKKWDKNWAIQPWYQWRRKLLAIEMNYLIADIWAIQEMMHDPLPRFTQTDFDNMIHNKVPQGENYFAKAFLPFNAIIPVANQHFKPGIVSRYPIIACKTHTKDRWQFESITLHFTNNVVEAVINIDGKEVTVLSTHLRAGTGSFDAKWRDGEGYRLAQIVTTLLAQGKSVILMGDLNDDLSDPKRSPVKRLSATKLGQPITAKQPPPYQNFVGTRTLGNNRRIDYIFLSPDLKLEKSGVAIPLNILKKADQEKTSDHLPVWANILIPPGNNPNKKWVFTCS